LKTPTGTNQAKQSNMGIETAMKETNPQKYLLIMPKNKASE
jgi:hypothetical protein